MSSEQTIQVDIDPTATMQGRYLGSDEDGPRYEQVTLYGAIVTAAADRLVALCEKDMRKDIVERVGAAAEALISERLPGIIDEALTGTITVTDDWGAERSSGTLREQIVKYARGQLTVSGRGSYNRETELDKAIKDHVGYSLSRELGEAVTEAKKKLLGELTRQTSETLTKAIYDGVRKAEL